MMTILSIFSSISRALLLSPLLLILRIISTIFLPVTVIARHISYLVSLFVYLPFTLLFRFEAIYIFCGTAAIIGVLTGTLLGLITHVFTGIFCLRDELETDTATYTQPKTPPTLSHDPLNRWNLSLGPKDPAPGQQQQPHIPISRMLFPQSIPTILEEEDEDPPFLSGNQAMRRRNKMGILETTWVGESDDSSNL